MYLAHVQRKSRAACCRDFSRGVNTLTTRQTTHANDFVNAKSHARESSSSLKMRILVIWLRVYLTIIIPLALMASE